MIDLTNPAQLLLVALVAIILMVLGSIIKDAEKEDIRFIATCALGVCLITGLYAIGALIYQNL